MTPFYFFSGLTLSDVLRGDVLLREPIIAAGLGDSLSDVRTNAQAAVVEIKSAGPGGSPGVLLAPIPASGNRKGLGYFPTRQRWQEFPRGLWAGVLTEEPPTPEELQRGTPINGYLLRLADGREWIVPTLRSPEGTQLPRQIVFPDPTNLEQVEERVKPDYQSIWEASAELVDVMFGVESEPQKPLAWKIAWCLRVLGLNYRIGPIEQSLLGIVDSENWYRILFAAIDGPLEREYRQRVAEEKKSAPAGD